MNDVLWLGVLGAVVLVLVDLWIIANVWRTDRSPSTKLGWVLIVVLLPILGLIAWGIAGPRSYKPVASREHSK